MFCRLFIFILTTEGSLSGAFGIFARASWMRSFFASIFGSHFGWFFDGFWLHFGWLFWWFFNEFSITFLRHMFDDFWKFVFRFFLFFWFPSFSANPRRHLFYCMNIMVCVGSPFSEKSTFHETYFRKVSNFRSSSGQFCIDFSSMFMTFSASIFA